MAVSTSTKILNKRTVKYLSVIYLLVGFSWLFAAILNHHLALGPNLISEYEGNGMSHSVLFRGFDAMSGLALLCAVWLSRQQIKQRLGRYVVPASLLIGLFSILDVITSPSCIVTARVCSPEYSSLLYLHFIESLLYGFTLFSLGVYVTLKDSKWWWGPTFQVVLGSIGIIASQFSNHASFALQVLTIIIQSYWLWLLLFGHLFKATDPPDIGFVRRSLAVLIALAGALSILGTSRFGHTNLTLGIWFGPATAWLSQHNVIVGFAFFYLARQIYLGERTAYKLTLWLMTLQVVKYSAVEPRAMPLVAYGITLVILIFSRDYFVRHSSTRHFIGRLRSVIFALLASFVAITVIGSVFRLRNPEIWERNGYSAGRIVMRATLLEVSSNSHDTLSVRLFGQVLTAAGIAMYAWILAGLFSPELYSLRHADEEEYERMLSILNEYGSNSEDSFKLWPRDKQYWFNSNDSVAIAYKQHKGYVIALESPVGSLRRRDRAASSFRDYCRQRGWKLVWLLANEKSAVQYEKDGLRTLKIGASAVVDLERYANETARNKWWRWIRNKNNKLGLVYEQIERPLSNITMAEVRTVSDAWLSYDNHSERSFALGYFDDAFIQNCTLHVLKDVQGKIVAFANQLPSYNNNKQTTIDLMRALPGYDGAVTYLLSEALINIYMQGHFKTFDLGFVPFAQTEETGAKKAVLALSTTILSAFFSARGLRQFKNKFEPSWHDNYIAWDGDWLDMPSITQALDKVLEYKPNLSADKG